MIKFIKRYLCLFSVLVSLFTPVFPNFLDDNVSLDDISIDNFLNDIDENDLVENEDNDLVDGEVKSSVSSEEEAVLIQIGEAIDAPLWKSTRPVRGRDPLYLMTASVRQPCFSGFDLNLFYNFTNKMPSKIGDSFGFSFRDAAAEKDFFDALEFLINYQKGSESANAEDLMGLLPLFEKLWVQERKAGLLARFGAYFKPFNFRLDLPILLSERNLMTTNADQEKINTLILENFGSFDSGSSKERELARIRLGIGDLRTSLGASLVDRSNFKLCGGFSVILPIAMGILRDGEFKKPEEPYADGSSFVGALNNARRNLLDPELGNRGHFGFGAYLESKLNLFHDTVRLWGRASYEDLFSAREKRLIMQKKKIEDPNIFLSDRPSDEEFIAFRDEYVVPGEYDVKVKPGGVYNVALMADFRWGHWLLGFGYDYYQKQREIFELIYNDSINMNSLRVDDAAVERAYQHKLTSELSYGIGLRKSKLNVGLGAEATVSHRNLGNAWTIYSKLNWTF